MKIKIDINLHSLWKKVRSGLQFLSQINWVSNYGSHMSLVSVLGVAGLVLAVRDGRVGNFKFLLSDTSSSEKRRFVPGLQNLGNNCFLNVVLQALASCSSFQHYLEEVEDMLLSSPERRIEDSPLLVSLASLLGELSTHHESFITLNPRKVMASMQEYIPQFQLTNQQDAAEALLHLLSGLRDELSESYMPSSGSLADVASPTSRFLSPKGIDHTNDARRWRKEYLGPFDGVLRSFLSCQSCSSEIMMDFGFFHTLSLPLTINTSASMLDRFSLEDCIERFLAPERVENYSCSHCWHISAVKFLSSVGGQRAPEDVQKLSCCSEQDSCACRNMVSLQTFPWSNRFSHTFKQLSIVHCPQILCLQLQRTSMNMFGELVKLQGHISFPRILNLSPFVMHEVGIQKLEANKQSKLMESQILTPIFNSGNKVVHSDPREAKEVSLETRSNTKFTCLEPQHKDAPRDYLYRLVSVVEHFGRAGSGHYIVYRGVTTPVDEGKDVRGSDIPPMQWFCVSDSKVHQSTEKDVLGAEASLLFYERIRVE